MPQDLNYKNDKDFIFNLKSSIVQMTTIGLEQSINFMKIIAKGCVIEPFQCTKNSRWTKLINLEKDYP